MDFKSEKSRPFQTEQKDKEQSRGQPAYAVGKNCNNDMPSLACNPYLATIKEINYCKHNDEQYAMIKIL